MLSRTLIRKNSKILHSREFGPIPKFPIVPYNINLISFRRPKLGLKYRKAKKSRVKKFAKVPAPPTITLLNINLLYKKFFKRAKVRKRVKTAIFKYKVFLQNNAPVVVGAYGWVGVAIKSAMRRGGK